MEQLLDHQLLSPSSSRAAPTVTYDSLMSAIQEAVRKEVSDAVSRTVPSLNSTTTVSEAAAGSSSGRMPMSSLSNVPILAAAVGNSKSELSCMSRTSESRTDSAITGVIVLPQCQGRLLKKSRIINSWI